MTLYEIMDAIAGSSVDEWHPLPRSGQDNGDMKARQIACMSAGWLLGGLAAR